jgi:hypothetical protein
MGYENAPQTHLLATHCMLCGKELCDAVSVEVGIGPVCRKRAGYAEGPEEHRKAANKLIHFVAVSKDNEARIEAMNKLLGLGFTGVVKAMLRAVATVKIAMTDENHPHGAGRYAVKTPYDPAVVAAMRHVPGRRWDKDGKVNTFPTTSRHKLWEVFQIHYHNAIGVSPKGIFRVAQGAQASGGGQVMKAVA